MSTAHQLASLQEGEQGCRTPTGPVMNLLRLDEAMPKATTEVLAEPLILVS